MNHSLHASHGGRRFSVELAENMSGLFMSVK